MSSGVHIRESPWNKNNCTVEQPTQSVWDIMSEQLAEQLEEENEIDPSIAQYGFTKNDFVDCKNDWELAAAIQEMFIRENEASARKDDKLEDKLGFFFEPHQHCSCSEEELSDDDDDLREIATDLRYSKPLILFPQCGFIRDSSGQLITKHDKEIAEKRNTDKVLQLPIDFPTGDVVGEKISNKVYNKLRNYSKNEQKKIMRLKDKNENAVNELSVDKVTRLILLKWLNSDFLDHIESAIATGKESLVLNAAGYDNFEEAHYAIKIFKMELNAFKNRLEYVQNDYRYKNPRRVLRVWAEREFTNLHRMVRARIKCPRPLKLRKHVMAMSFIGSNGVAAPKLKDISFRDHDHKLNMFNQIREGIMRLFNECNLVHADLSEFNILCHNDEIYFIDVSQAMDVSHPRSLYFLVRDIENVLRFFQKADTEDLPIASDMFNDITGLNMLPDKNIYVQVENFSRDNRTAQLRYDKANPADMDLRLYDAEVSLSHEDPAKAYN